MIKEYNNGKIITDGNFEQPVAVSSPRFSFPFENHRSVELIEQDFVVRSENFNQLPLGTRHPVYTNAVLVTEDGFSNMAGGLVKFVRTFLIFPNETFIFPRTSNVSFPAIKLDLTNSYVDINDEREIPNLRESFSKVVSCEEHVTFVDLASDSEQVIRNDSHIDRSTISFGDTIYNWSTSSFFSITEVATNYFVAVSITDSNDSRSFHISQRGNSWNIYSPVLNFDSIPINEKFSPKTTNIFNSPIQYTSAYQNNPEAVESVESSVDFVSFNTRPTIIQYMSYIKNSSNIQIEDTKIEQFKGHVYKVTELFTKAR